MLPFLQPHHRAGGLGAGAQHLQRHPVLPGQKNAAGVQHLGAALCHFQHLIIGDALIPAALGEFPRVTVVHTVHIGTDAAPAGIKGRGQRHRGGITASPPQCGDIALTVHPLEPRHNHDLPGLQLPQDAASVQRRDLRGSMVAIGMDAGLPAGEGNSGKPPFLQGHGHQRSGCLLPGGQ